MQCCASPVQSDTSCQHVHALTRLFKFLLFHGDVAQYDMAVGLLSQPDRSTPKAKVSIAAAHHKNCEPIHDLLYHAYLTMSGISLYPETTVSIVDESWCKLAEFEMIRACKVHTGFFICFEKHSTELEMSSCDCAAPRRKQRRLCRHRCHTADISHWIRWALDRPDCLLQDFTEITLLHLSACSPSSRSCTREQETRHEG